MTRPHVVMLPGFQGAANQPVLVRFDRALSEAGFSCTRLALPKGRPSPQLEREVAFLREAVVPRRSASTASREARQDVVLVGRSFGGRVAARYANAHGAAAVVLLGFPVRPPGTSRPDDEAALAALSCPTLIVQGTRDDKGPMRVLRAAIRANANVTLHPLKGARHDFGRHTKAAIDVVTEWLLVHGA